MKDHIGSQLVLKHLTDPVITSLRVVALLRKLASTDGQDKTVPASEDDIAHIILPIWI